MTDLTALFSRLMGDSYSRMEKLARKELSNDSDSYRIAYYIRCAGWSKPCHYTSYQEQEKVTTSFTSRTMNLSKITSMIVAWLKKAGQIGSKTHGVVIYLSMHQLNHSESFSIERILCNDQRISTQILILLFR